MVLVLTTLNGSGFRGGRGRDGINVVSLRSMTKITDEYRSNEVQRMKYGCRVHMSGRGKSGCIVQCWNSIGNSIGIGMFVVATSDLGPGGKVFMSECLLLVEPNAPGRQAHLAGVAG
jgi:hypothetical protein